YSFSTGTHGSSRRCSMTLRFSSACSASSFASSARAACHSSRVPILSGIRLSSRGVVGYDASWLRNSSVASSRTSALLDEFPDEAVKGLLATAGEPADASAFYDPATWARLRAVKTAYDPDDAFVGNHHIPPA